MKPLVWTNDKPKGGGWWWYRVNPNSHVFMVMVKEWAHFPLEATFLTHGCEPYTKNVKECDGQWSGPIQPPQDI